MEAKLFWISMTSGAYALLLRWFVKDDARVADHRRTALVHGVFWTLAGGVAAVLFTSYRERPDLTWPLMAGLGAAGFLWGAVRRWRKGPGAGASWRFLREDLEWADTGFSAILLAAFIMYFFVQAFKIPSGSMKDTLLIGDHLFVNKFIYGFRIPLTGGKKVLRLRPVQRRDIVVFRFPAEDKRNPHYGKDFIKRAVGLPGDVIEIRDKVLYVNGQAQEEPYIRLADRNIYPGVTFDGGPVELQARWGDGSLPRLVGEAVRDNFGPVTVPEGHYFVMGDNRDESYDSRFWGPMPERELKGRAWLVYLPFRRIKIIK